MSSERERELFLALISLHAATERGHGNGNFSSHMTTTLRMGSHYEIMKRKKKKKKSFCSHEREREWSWFEWWQKLNVKEDKNEKISSSRQSSHWGDEKWVRLRNMWHAKETSESQLRLWVTSRTRKVKNLHFACTSPICIKLHVRLHGNLSFWMRVKVNEKKSDMKRVISALRAARLLKNMSL